MVRDVSECTGSAACVRECVRMRVCSCMCGRASCNDRPTVLGCESRTLGQLVYHVTAMKIWAQVEECRDQVVTAVRIAIVDVPADFVSLFVSHVLKLSPATRVSDLLFYRTTRKSHIMHTVVCIPGSDGETEIGACDCYIATTMCGCTHCASVRTFFY